MGLEAVKQDKQVLQFAHKAVQNKNGFLNMIHIFIILNMFSNQ